MNEWMYVLHTLLSNLIHRVPFLFRLIRGEACGITGVSAELPSEVLSAQTEPCKQDFSSFQVHT